jgi:hypothetical protein
LSRRGRDFTADDVRETAISENPTSVLREPAEKEVALFISKGLEQALQREIAGSIHVERNPEPQNDDTQQ